MKNKKYEIDAKTLISCLWKDRKTMIKYLAVAFVAGIIIAFTTPKEYTTSVKLAPEETNSMLSGGISSLASMVGMDFGQNMAGDAIFPEIYPDLMNSTDFLVSLFDMKVTSQDGELTTTYFDYMRSHQKVALLDYPKVWLSNLITKIRYGSSLGNGNDKVDPFCLSYGQYNGAMSIAKHIKCSVDKKTSVITISVKAQDPLISAVVADSVKTRLQNYITMYRTTKARNDLKYMEKLFEQSKKDYIQARHNYANFCDANQGLVLQQYKSKEEELENDMQLKFNIYTQVAQQLQMTKAKLQERTPAFTTLQMASVPIKASSMPRLFILIIVMFLGFMLRFGILFYKNFNTIMITANDEK